MEPGNFAAQMGDSAARMGRQGARMGDPSVRIWALRELTGYAAAGMGGAWVRVNLNRVGFQGITEKPTCTAACPPELADATVQRKRVGRSGSY